MAFFFSINMQLFSLKSAKFVIFHEKFLKYEFFWLLINFKCTIIFASVRYYFDEYRAKLTIFVTKFWIMNWIELSFCVSTLFFHQKSPIINCQIMNFSCGWLILNAWFFCVNTLSFCHFSWLIVLKSTFFSFA